MRTVSSKRQWAYAAALPIRFFGYTGQKGVLQLRVKVTKGKMGFGLIDSANQFQTEQIVSPGADFQQISLELGPAGGPRTLIVRSTAENGSLSEAVLEALDLSLPATKLQNAVSVSRVYPTNAAAVIEPANPLRVVTAPQRYTYAASFPLALGNAPGVLIVRAQGKVVRGRIGIGVLNQDQKSFQSEEYAAKGPQSASIFVPIPSTATAGTVIVRNESEGISEILIDDVAVYTLR